MRTRRSPLTIENLLARDEIADTLRNYADGLDELDAVCFLDMFLEEIILDLSSWNGRPAKRVRVTDWITDVMGRLSGFDATQHLLINPAITLDGDRATSRPQMIALHYLATDDQRRMHGIGGSYHHDWIRTANGWKVEALRLDLRWEMGERDLFRLASERPDKRAIKTAFIQGHLPAFVPEI